jgi:hypothetical protein
MIRTSIATSTSAQSGYAGIDIMAPTIARLATPIPNQRPKAPPRQIDIAASASRAPNPIATQPHVLRSLRM